MFLRAIVWQDHQHGLAMNSSKNGLRFCEHYDVSMGPMYLDVL